MADAWPDADIALLKKLREDGLSFAAIAARLSGNKSRNAVIAKAHRIGLAGTGPRAHQTSKRQRRVVAEKRPASTSPLGQGRAPKLRAEPTPAIGPDLVIPPERRKSLVDLEPGDCHWPIGDPAQPDFHFCDRKAGAPGARYCEFHMQRAYQAPALRRVRAPKAFVRKKHGHYDFVA